MTALRADKRMSGIEYLKVRAVNVVNGCNQY